MRVERLELTAFRLRASLLWLAFLGMAGVALVLAFERHWDGYWQLVPWATLGALFIGLLALVIFPSPPTRKLVQVVAVATVIVSCMGMWQHFDENYQTASLDANYTDLWEEMSIFEKVWEVAKGSVGHVPIYAAAALIPIALALVMATIGLGDMSSYGDDVDPRRRG